MNSQNLTREELLTWHKEDQKQLADMRNVITRLRTDLQGALKNVNQYRQYTERVQLAARKAQSTNNTWDLEDLIDEALDGQNQDTETHVVTDDSENPECTDDRPGCTLPEGVTENDWKFLTFALDRTFDHMVSGEGFTEDDFRSLEKFRLLAREAGELK